VVLPGLGMMMQVAVFIRKKKIPIHAGATFGALGALIDKAVAKFRG
jgi:hypothetical protein